MTIEDAVTALRELGLHVENTRSGNGDADITVQGDLVSLSGRTIYYWLCWIQEEESFWIVSPPPHPANDRGPALVVRTLEEAVSLTAFLFDRRLKLGSKHLGQEAEHTQRLHEEWFNGKG